MRRFVFTLALVLCWGFQGLIAQEDSSATTTNDFLNDIWRNTFRPYIEGSWGYVQPKHINLKSELATTGILELRFGYSELTNYYSFVRHLEERFLFAGKTSQSYNHIDSEPAGIKTGYTRFGGGNRVGYGYKIGPMSLIPYYQAEYVWSEMSYDSSLVMDDAEQEILGRYPGAYRFGMASEGGIKLELFKKFAVYGGFEYSVIYPRYIFWEWLGSALIISSAQGIITMFSEDIVETSPLMGPLVYFVLRNGLTWFYYQELREEMNWPFDSEAPLTLETFKLGVSFTF